MSHTIAEKVPDTFFSVVTGDRWIVRQMRLVCIREDRSDYETKRTLHEEVFTEQIESVVLEQSGPVRAVVKITGKHKSDSGERAWLRYRQSSCEAESSKYEGGTLAGVVAAECTLERSEAHLRELESMRKTLRSP